MLFDYTKFNVQNGYNFRCINLVCMYIACILAYNVDQGDSYMLYFKSKLKLII